jgi:uncharacterized protein YukE
MAHTHVGPGHVMAQAIVDPAEIRRFAHNLKVFTGDVRGDLSSLHTQLLALGDTWRDQEHDRFTQEFEQTVAVLEKFLDVAEQHVPFLLRKAERIEDYLTQR